MYTILVLSDDYAPTIDQSIIHASITDPLMTTNPVKKEHTYHISSPPTFLLRNLFNSPLYLGDVDRLIIDDNSIAQNSADLAEFVFVASYEVESFHLGDLWLSVSSEFKMFEG